MELMGTIFGIIGCGFGILGYIFGVLATKRIKNLEQQLIDLKVIDSATSL